LTLLKKKGINNFLATNLDDSKLQFNIKNMIDLINDKV